MTTLGDMYETGVLVQNPNMVSANFRKRMGYRNPDPQVTAVIGAQTYGFQGSWQHVVREKKLIVLGINTGRPPNEAADTVAYQRRAMDPPFPYKSHKRMQMINPSWATASNKFGGHSGTIEMLAGGHEFPLPFANDSLEEVSALALDEHARSAKRDPLSNTYALNIIRNDTQDNEEYRTRRDLEEGRGEDAVAELKDKAGASSEGTAVGSQTNDVDEAQDAGKRKREEDTKDTLEENNDIEGDESDDDLLYSEDDTEVDYGESEEEEEEEVFPRLRLGYGGAVVSPEKEELSVEERVGASAGKALKNVFKKISPPKNLRSPQPTKLTPPKLRSGRVYNPNSSKVEELGPSPIKSTTPPSSHYYKKYKLGKGK